MRRLSMLLFVSGFSGLVYQVLWQKQLSYLLGATVHATATAIGVFFVGLTVGQWWAGSRAAEQPSPLAVYGRLEAAIAVAALSFLALPPALRLLYPFLLSVVGDGLGLASARALVAAVVLSPSAILMGATLPMIAEHVGRGATVWARPMAGLYAANTLGAATGAGAAGFILPEALGLRAAYGVAIAGNLVAAAVALRTAARQPVHAVRYTAAPPVARSALPHQAVALAFLSGCLALAMQVLWTRMFAQVLHNSVYSFASILIVFLTALGLGALAARVLGGRGIDPAPTLAMILLTAGISVIASPFVFDRLTGGLAYVAPEAGWLEYLATAVGLAAAVVGFPCLLLGMVFPYLLKVYERDERVGELVGRLASANTIGAIVGSVVAGFVALPQIGLWPSVRTVGVLYVIAALWSSERAGRWRRPLVAGVALAVVAATTIADPGRLPRVAVDATRGEAVVSVLEGAYGTVAVVGRGEELRIKLDNWYTVGGTGSIANDRRQADLPLWIAGAARSVFFLGIGSGITAGAAVAHPVERIVVAELIPEVVSAARRHFTSHTDGLFEDPRVDVVHADGRNWLLAQDDEFDVIVADLFTPWQAGTASLYTIEHYQTVRARLRPGGVFAQWLPLYQLSRREFSIIARTMLAVFPEVTLWRGEFLPQAPIVALVGRSNRAPLDVVAMLNALRQLPRMREVPEDVGLAMMMLFYVGNLGEVPRLVDDVPLNTDDLPVIEYEAPRTQRAVASGTAQWFIGAEFLEFVDRLAAALPPEMDPVLAVGDERIPRFVRAGADLGRAVALAEAGELAAARAAFDAFSDGVPLPLYRMFRRHFEQRWPRLFEPGPS